MNKINSKASRLILVSVIGMAAACSTPGKSGAVVVESANYDSRVNIVVIHHTSEDFQGSLDILTQPSGYSVSSHYLVPEPLDPSYTDEELRVYALVPEDQRAWHAGHSYWKEQTKLNNVSVGIEIVNETYCHRAENMAKESMADWPSETICFYPDYPESQIALVIDLLKDILSRHGEVKPTHIIGHSDIAPQRKIDPGPRFPWERLYKLGIGAWYDDATVIRYWERFNGQMPTVLQMQEALHVYGYRIERTGELDEQTRNVLRAFQHHFLPYRVSKEFTVETAAVLYALVEKYYASELEPLLPAPD
ncbi:MAG: N-acetylmuramoyl-L-alanine amidase [Xanthomonadales bacterium]|jgi:N-acetylmuramoyl-L-alanine amidase|nr:N-acetylmuramoyl-L-alanine amidase [Xanthomonadales bacterium]